MGGVQRKVTELMMALMQCQQNVEIPEIQLLVDSDIQVAFEEQRKKEDQEPPQLDAFADRLNNVQWVNRVHGGVNKWAKLRS